MRGSTTSGAIILFLLAPLLTAAQADNGTIQSIASSLRARQYENSLQLLDPALRQFPRDVRLWTMQGVALSGLRRSGESLVAYRHALKLSPDYLPALEGAAQLEYESGDKDIVPILQHILKLRPDSATSHAMLAVLFYKQGDYSEAARHFAQSGPILDSQPAALQQYGSCLVRLNQLDQALGVFQKLLDLNPDDSHNRLRLAEVQLKAEHPKEAIATLQSLLQGLPRPTFSSWPPPPLRLTAILLRPKAL